MIGWGSSLGHLVYRSTQSGIRVGKGHDSGHARIDAAWKNTANLLRQRQDSTPLAARHMYMSPQSVGWQFIGHNDLKLRVFATGFPADGRRSGDEVGYLIAAIIVDGTAAGQPNVVATACNMIKRAAQMT